MRKRETGAENAAARRRRLGFFYATHDRAEEVDHSVLRPTLPGGRGGGFLRAWGEGASERSLGETRRRVRGREDVIYKGFTAVWWMV